MKGSEKQSIDLGMAVRMMRHQRGLTQIELATLIGSPRSESSQISNWERHGKVTIGALKRVARATGFSIEIRFVSDRQRSLSPMTIVVDG